MALIFQDEFNLDKFINLIVLSVKIGIDPNVTVGE